MTKTKSNNQTGEERKEKKAGTILYRGITSTFMTGLFVLLPLALTIAILNWIGGYIHAIVGPESLLGEFIEKIGIAGTANQIITTALGWIILFGGIFGFGIFVRIVGKKKIQNSFNQILLRIPFINNLYGSVSKVVEMFDKDTQKEMKGMNVVYCDFGQENGVGFLGLLVSDQVYQFNDKECCLVYVPTSPVPMSGGIIFVPQKIITTVEMELEKFMQIYFSIGVLASNVIPKKYFSDFDMSQQLGESQ